MNLRFLSAAAFPLIWLLALPAWAAEYRLEVADLDYQTMVSEPLKPLHRGPPGGWERAQRQKKSPSSMHVKWA